MVAYLLSPNSCHWWIAKVKNYNLNVTEVLVSDFKNAFPRNFQLHRRDPIPGPNLTRCTASTVRKDNEWVTKICILDRFMVYKLYCLPSKTQSIWSMFDYEMLL